MSLSKFIIETKKTDNKTDIYEDFSEEFKYNSQKTDNKTEKTKDLSYLLDVKSKSNSKYWTLVDRFVSKTLIDKGKLCFYIDKKTINNKPNQHYIKDRYCTLQIELVKQTEWFEYTVNQIIRDIKKYKDLENFNMTVLVKTPKETFVIDELIQGILHNK